MAADVSGGQQACNDAGSEGVEAENRAVLTSNPAGDPDAGASASAGATDAASPAKQGGDSAADAGEAVAAPLNGDPAVVAAHEQPCEVDSREAKPEDVPDVAMEGQPVDEEDDAMEIDDVGDPSAVPPRESVPAAAAQDAGGDATAAAPHNEGEAAPAAPQDFGGGSAVFVAHDIPREAAQNAQSDGVHPMDTDGAAAPASPSELERRLLVRGVPEGVLDAELADFLSGAVLAAAGHAAAVEPAAPTPCMACTLSAASGSGSLEAVVVFRTACSASVALRLDGLECRGAQLRLSRPPDYVAPPDGDPAATLTFEGLLLADLVGKVETADTGQAHASQRAEHMEGETPAAAKRDPDASAPPAEPAREDTAPPCAAAGSSSDKEPHRSSAGTEPSASRPEGAQGESRGEQAGAPEGSRASGEAGPHEGSAKMMSEERVPTDHYEALGVPQRATVLEVKKAYHAKCRLHHPDKNRHDANATAKFQRVAEAYQVLSSPTKRAQYDATLAMQRACGSLGVQHDPRAAAFVQRHSGLPGREVQGMQIESRHVGNLIGKSGYQLQQLKQQSGADILVLQNQLSVYAQVLLAGPPAVIARAKNLITASIAELTGVQAPRDGVVLLVPQQLLPRMPQVAAQFQAIFLQTGAAARFATADRIVVQGGLRVPQAVVQIQWTLEWRGHILMPNGQQMDPWTYAHVCEAAAIAAGAARSGDAFQYLLPPADPDAATVRHLLCFALSTTDEAERNTSMVELAIRAVQAHHAGHPVTGALVRAATSVAVHAEHASLSEKAGAPLLCALHSILPVAGTAVAPRFASAPLFKTLTALIAALNDPREGLALRARGFTAVREAVPEDYSWHSWDSLLKPDGALATFWKDLRTWVSDRRHALGVSSPPSDWLSVPAVMCTLLRVCIGPPLECDLSHGIRRQASAGTAASQAPPKGSLEPGHTKPKEKAVPAAEPAPAPAVPPGACMLDEGRVDEDQMTLVEHVEEVLFSLAGNDPSSYVHIGMVTQEAQKRVSSIGERLSKKWYESHRGSFELKRLHHSSGGGDEWKVRLVGSAQARAAARMHERQAEAQRVRELRIAEEVLPKLSADNVPRTLRSPELAGLVCVLSKGQHKVGDDLPSALLRRLCRRGDATPKELLQESTPFPPALLMRAIVALEKQRRERWDRDALDMVLQAAALDMHAVDERPRAALPTAAAALWAAARRPFDDRLSAGRCLLVPSAALRLQVELAEQSALSPDGSAFRPFAQMCAWLAHLVVTASLPQEVRGEVLQAFKKLASACEDLAKSPEAAPCDPEGLCRLAMAVALVARDEKGSIGGEALQGLARVCVQRAMDEAFHWRPQQLAVLASAYAAAEVPHEGLFRKIAVAAERHTMLGNEWSTEQLLKLLHSAWQLGQLGTLEKLLRGLQSDHGLQRYVREATSRDLPLLFSVLVLIDDRAMLEELTKSHREKLHGVSLHGLVAILKDWPSLEKGTGAFAPFKAAVIREAIGLASRKAPTLAELQVLVSAAAEDAKALSRLTELAASPAILSSLPPTDATWQELSSSVSGVLSPFFNTGVEVPRLEAACIARLLPAIDKSTSEVRDFLPPLLVLHESTLVAMPVLTEAVADKLAKVRLPRAGSSEALDVRKLCERLLHAAAKLGRGMNRSSGDSELDGWVERLERCALDDGRAGSERRLEWLDQQASRRLSPSARDALGTSWHTILLVRSKKLTWLGGKMVLLDPPKPRSAVKKLAEVASAFFSPALRLEVDALEPDGLSSASQASESATGRPGTTAASAAASYNTTYSAAGHRARAPPAAGEASGAAWREPIGASGPTPPARPPPGALVVSGGWDKGMAETIAGTYMPSSTNHNRAVYRRVDPPCEGRVLLYYWDDRDGDEQRGWWFGPEVGGEEVWAHNAGSSSNALPPARGWRVLHSGGVDPALTVTKVEAPRTPPPAPAASSASARASGPAPQGRRPPPAAPAAGPPLGQPPASTGGGTKRPRLDGARAAELHAWLEGLDDGAGAMLQYFDVLAAEFDADLAQIAAAKVEGGEKHGILGVVDPSFWETVRVEKTGHKMLFARGIAKL